MKILDIISNNEYLYSGVDPEAEFDSITTDINEVSDKSVLIISNSAKIDVDLKLKAKPCAIICDTPDILKDEDAKIIVVNARYALAHALCRYYKIDFSKFTTIGITGTNGKTSTATMIKQILTKSGQKTGFIGTGVIEIGEEVITPEEYSMTTPDPTLLYKAIKKMEEEGCTAIIMEVSSHALALDKVAAIPFDYGIFTNLEEDHLDFHGSKESYFEAKLKLFNLCKTAVFNIDDAYARRALGLSRTERTICVGALWRGDVYATNVENHGLDGISYMYHGNNFIFKMNLKLNGIYNTYNSMLASAVCIDLKCKPCEVKRILGNIEYIPGRYEIIRDEVTVIIDYAHTESAFEAVLKDVKDNTLDNELTVIFGCGGQRDRKKRPQMAKIAEKYADNIIVTSDNSRNEPTESIFKDIIKGFSKEHLTIKNRTEAINYAISYAKCGEIILLVGKGCEKYYIDSLGYHNYSEKDIVNAALTERRLKKQYANKA